jgi:hypothetical protein
MKSRSLEFCCSYFQRGLEAEGRRGLSIIPHRHLCLGNYFFIAFRAIDKENDEKTPPFSTVPLVRFTEAAIKFCPWCGADLATFYQHTFDQLPSTVDDGS